MLPQVLHIARRPQAVRQVFEARLRIAHPLLDGQRLKIKRSKCRQVLRQGTVLQMRSQQKAANRLVPKLLSAPVVPNIGAGWVQALRFGQRHRQRKLLDEPGRHLLLAQVVADAQGQGNGFVVALRGHAYRAGIPHGVLRR
nr:hypothetical protein [Tanacetum cinerariifolium]